ncbi:hypothetical protein [Azospirillum sp. TSO5]|uniref:hypothetical protein n=1 Tax=Azospirillum sp. TSO5 TaxID=716760 RepID=UPI0011B20302|nr:hypothetical protein [Azospirillum sp. TSO5]
MKADVTIKRLDDGTLSLRMDRALNSNFRYIPIFSVSDGSDGDRIYGTLPPEFVLSILNQEDGSGCIAIGVEFVKGIIRLQSRVIAPEYIESFLKNTFGWLPVRKIDLLYCRQEHKGEWCYLVISEKIEQGTFGWNLKRITNRPRSVLDKIKNDFGAGRELSDWDTQLTSISISRYLERRAAIKPNAIETRYAPNDLPILLGLGVNEDGRGCLDEALAALGRNGQLESAIYVRSGYGPDVSKKDIMGWTERSFRYHKGILGNNTKECMTRVSPLDHLTPGEPSQERERSGLGGKMYPNIYRLGGDVFDVVSSIENVVSDPVEIFRGERIAPSRFNQRTFGMALKELAVNAFVHGYWYSEHHSTRDYEAIGQSAKAMAIVHLGNRIEFINRQVPRPRNKIIRDDWRHYPLMRSNLHVALKDIGLAHCRNIGLKLVQSRIMKMGMPSPLVLDTEKFFRVIIPMQDHFGTIAVPVDTQPGNAGIKLVERFFALNLCLLLRRVDEEIASSALGIAMSDAGSQLAQLWEHGMLAREDDIRYSTEWNEERFDLPSYRIDDEGLVLDELKRVSSELALLPAPEGMSPRGLYALSTAYHYMRGLNWFDRTEPDWVRSARSDERERQRERETISRIFTEEGVYGPDAPNLALRYHEKIVKLLLEHSGGCQSPS